MFGISAADKIASAAGPRWCAVMINTDAKHRRFALGCFVLTCAQRVAEWLQISQTPLVASHVGKGLHAPFAGCSLSARTPERARLRAGSMARVPFGYRWLHGFAAANAGDHLAPHRDKQRDADQLPDRGRGDHLSGQPDPAGAGQGPQEPRPGLFPEPDEELYRGVQDDPAHEQAGDDRRQTRHRWNLDAGNSAHQVQVLAAGDRIYMVVYVGRRARRTARTRRASGVRSS